MSTQLCAYLKQLAMVTKKAAVNFPDKLAQAIACVFPLMAFHYSLYEKYIKTTFSQSDI